MNSRICASSSATASGFSLTRPLADSAGTTATGCGATSSRSAGGVSSSVAGVCSAAGASLRVALDMCDILRGAAALLKALFDTGNHSLEPFMARRIHDVAERLGHHDAALGPDFRSTRVSASAEAKFVCERLQFGIGGERFA